jgi:hypothetical protein
MTLLLLRAFGGSGRPEAGPGWEEIADRRSGERARDEVGRISVAEDRGKLTEYLTEYLHETAWQSTSD